MDVPDDAKRARRILARLTNLRPLANAGDQAALAKLRRLLAKNSWLTKHLGDLTKHLESVLLEKLAGGDSLLREAVRQRLQGLKVQLSGARPTVMEELLVDQVAVTWLAQHHAVQIEASTTDETPQQMALRLRRSESTQRRFLQSLKVLAHIRAFAPRGLTPLDTTLFQRARRRA